MFRGRRPGAVGGPDGARMSAASRLTHGPAPALGGSTVTLLRSRDVRGQDWWHARPGFNAPPRARWWRPG